MKKILKKEYLILAIIVVVAIAYNFLMTYMNLMLKDVTDLVFSKDANFDKFFSLLKKGAIVFVSMFPVNLLLAYLEALFYKRSMLNTKKFYIQQVFSKNINEFQQENFSKYFSNITNDMDTIEEKYFTGIYIVITFGIQVLFALGVVIYVNFQLVLVILIAMSIVITFFSLMGKILQKYQKEKSELLSFYTAYAKEALSAFQIIKTNNLEKRVISEFDKRSKNVQEKNYHIDKVSSLIDCFQYMLVAIVIIATLFVVIYMGIKGMLTMGMVVLLINSVANIGQPVEMISQALPQLTSIKKVIESMEENLKNKTQSEEKFSFSNFTKDIEIKDLSFSYGENKILENANAYFEKGKKYLIVGPSGGGKSTLLKLLRKYFNSYSGNINVDGINLKELNTNNFYAKIANVEQNVFLFDDTIKNNITLYQNYSDDEVLFAIEKAGLSDFIEKQSEGLQSKILDNGKNISGGERARIAIARGIIRKAEIIFLDEAFASLDYTNVKKIEETLLNLQNITLINVSHVIISENKSKYDSVLKVAGKKIVVES